MRTFVSPCECHLAPSNLIFFALASLFRTCPKSDPRFKTLVKRVTQNFDTFDDYGSNLDDGMGKQRVQKTSLDHFYNYDYRRVRKPRIPLPGLQGV